MTARLRPELTPRSVTCPSCGTTLRQRSDATRFVVCRYCSAHLELDDVEAQVLGGGEKRAGFDYEIDDFFLWDHIRYVVAARMVFRQEDAGYVSETVEYLLWSPRRGTLYLDFDDGRWLLSRMAHVMPRCEDAFALREGVNVETYDGRRWTFTEAGTGTLVYVDGALPWVARVGDRVDYATFFGERDRDKGYEVERDSGELEFCEFRVVHRGELDAASQRKREAPVTSPPAIVDDPAPSFLPSIDERSATRTWLLAMALVCLGFCAINGTLSARAAQEGVVVLDRTIVPGFQPPPAAQLPDPAAAAITDAGAASAGDDDKSDSGQDAADDDRTDPPDPPEPEEVPVIGGVELATDSFTLAKSTALLIELSAPAIQEAWASVDVAVVQGADSATHIMDAELSRYDDDDDGSEGTQKDNLYAWIEEAGTYHLVLRLMGGRGEIETPGDIPVAVRVRAISKTRIQTPFTWVAVVSMVLAVAFVGAWMIARRGEQKEEGGEKEE